MNIFVLDEDPVRAAQMHCDKHVVKMITESAQLLSSAYYYTEQSALAPYRLSHQNHPCAIWARESLDNWAWLYFLGIALYDEYKFRYYNRTHRAGEVIRQMVTYLPDLPSLGMTPHPLCMPMECKVIGDAVESYHNYYRMHKRHILAYTKRNFPDWIKEE